MRLHRSRRGCAFGHRVVRDHFQHPLASWTVYLGAYDRQTAAKLQRLAQCPQRRADTGTDEALVEGQCGTEAGSYYVSFTFTYLVA